MDSLSFVYWLQGLLEIGDPKSLDEKQIKIIKDHIALVLEKKTPDYTEIDWPAKKENVRIPYPNPFPYTPTDDNSWKRKRPMSSTEIWCNSSPEVSC